jgi:Glycosyl transferase family 2
MTRLRIPDEVLSAAHARSQARADRDWTRADELRAEIEAAGWKVVDRGTDFALSPIALPDVEDGARTRYGSSQAVPSRLDEPSEGAATVVLVATDWPVDLDRTIAAFRSHAPVGTGIIVVADAPSDEQAERLGVIEAVPADGDHPIEISWTGTRLGQGESLDIGLRRATGGVVIVADTSVEPTGDVVTPLLRALDDPTIAVAGAFGIVSDDLRKFRDAPAGDVDAVEGYLQAFRREDYRVRGPFDARFRFYRNLDIWWSLVLRDEGEGEPSRRAVALEDLPLTRHEHRGWTSLPDEDRDRQSKRNFYRIIDRFGSRRDLLISSM